MSNEDLSWLAGLIDCEGWFIAHVEQYGNFKRRDTHCLIGRYPLQ